MSYIQVRIDEETKASAKKVLKKMGLDMSGAIKLFLTQVSIQKRVPFPLTTENGMTLEEENDTLKVLEEAKKDFANGRTVSLEEVKRQLFG